MKMNEQISRWDKLNILFRTGIKAARGGVSEVIPKAGQGIIFGRKTCAYIPWKAYYLW